VYQYAAPDAWRDMLGTASEHVGALWSIDHELQWVSKYDSRGDCPISDVCRFANRSSSWTECRYLANGSALLDAGPIPPGGWKYVSWGLEDCAGSPGHSITMSLLSDTIPILRVPLTDLPEGVDQPWVRQ
jgi:hypothetical protein